MGTSLNRVEEEDYSSYTNSSDFISISLEDNNNTTTTATSTSKSSSELHPVCLPPRVTTWQKLNHRLREIFFPDDPLHIFKDQSWRRKLVLAFQYVFPILRWAPHYSLSLFRSDLIAGLTIASLAIPQVQSMHAFLFLLFFIIYSCFFFLFIQFFILFWHLQGISYAKLANLQPIIGLCKNKCFTIFFLNERIIYLYILQIQALCHQ